MYRKRQAANFYALIGLILLGLLTSQFLPTAANAHPLYTHLPDDSSWQPSTDAGRLFRQALALYRQGNLAGALDAFEEAQTLYTEDDNQQGQAISRLYVERIRQELGLPPQEISIPAPDIAPSNAISDTVISDTVISTAEFDAERLEALRDLLSAAKAYQSSNQLELATENYEQALPLARSLTDVARTLTILDSLGRIYRDSQRFGDALSIYQEALPLWQQLGDKGRELRTYNALAESYRALGESTRAIKAYAQMLALAQEIEEVSLALRALESIAELHQELGELAAAADRYAEAGSIAEEAEQMSDSARYFDRAGRLYAEMENAAAGILAYSKAASTWATLDDFARSIRSRLTQGTLEEANDDPTSAINTYKAAEELATENLTTEPNDLRLLARTLEAQANLHRKQGRLDQAVSLYPRAIATALEAVDTERAARMADTLGRTLRAQEKFDESLAAFVQAEALWQEVGKPERALKSLLAIAASHASLNAVPTAIDTMEAAVSLAQTLDDAAQLASVWEAKAALHRAQAQPEAAVAAYQEGADALLDSADLRGAVRLLNAIGKIQTEQGQLTQAIASYRAIAELWAEAGERQNEIEALLILASLHLSQAEASQKEDNQEEIGQEEGDKAFEAYERAKNLAIELEDPDQAAEILATMAKLYRKEQQFEKAEAAYAELLAIQESRPGATASSTLVGRAANFAAAGDTEQALATYQEALTVAESTGDSATMATIYDQIGRLHRSTKNFTESTEAFQEGARIWQDLDEIARAIKLKLAIGFNHKDAGDDLDAVVVIFDEANDLAVAAGDQALSASVMDATGRLRRDLDDVEGAIYEYRLALDLWTEIDTADAVEGATATSKNLLALYRTLGANHRDRDEISQAIQAYQQALVFAQQLDDSTKAASLYDQLGQLYRIQKQVDDAIRAYKQAVQTWSAEGEIERETNSRRSLWNLYMAQEQFQEAQTVAGFASGITAPLEGGAIGGFFKIEGLAQHTDFRKWQLDLLIDGDENQASFLFAKSRQTWGKLFTIDTAKYPNGPHKLRLRIVRSDTNYDEYFVSMTIQN